MTTFIPVMPLRLMPFLSMGDLHFCQAHLFEGLEGADEEIVRKWMQVNSRRIILDNGGYELGAPDVSATIRVAKELKPYEVVCPDVYQDKDRTLKLFHAHASSLATVAERVMIVPHGKDVVEWIECLDTMLTSETLRSVPNLTIGVPKVLDSYTGGRSAVLAWIEANVSLQDIQVHLLGMWRWISTPAQLISSFPWIRSFDTTWPYACAIAGEYATATTGKHIIQDWNPGYLSTDVIRLAEINIAICQKTVNMAQAEGMRMGHG